MLYPDDVPHVEVGVLLTRPCPLTGSVVASSLPAGRVVTPVHQGSFGDIGDAHDAVVRWSVAQGLRLDRTRWEIYGPHHDDPVRQQTQVFWRLSPGEEGAGRAGVSVR